MTVHWAYSVVLEAGMVKLAPAEYAVPDPPEAVFQPANVCPERVGAAPTVTDPAYAAVCVAGTEIVCDTTLSSYVTV